MGLRPFGSGNQAARFFLGSQALKAIAAWQDDKASVQIGVGQMHNATTYAVMEPVGEMPALPTGTLKDQAYTFRG